MLKINSINVSLIAFLHDYNKALLIGITVISACSSACHCRHYI